MADFVCGEWMARTKFKSLITAEETYMTKLLDENHPGEVLKRTSWFLWGFPLGSFLARTNQN